MIAHHSLIFRCFRLIFITLSAVFAIVVAFQSQAAPELADPLPYAAHFDPDRGFKLVQPNLSRVFLQMAGSLEHFGTPENYIRHVMAEHSRIDAKHHATGGKGSSRPAYLTDDYVDNLIANWNKVAPPLKLDAFCREAGRDIRYAILGSKNMEVPELVTLETALTDDEREAYRRLLDKPYFMKVDFPVMDAFYGSSFDKLTDTGKDQISRRTRLGTLPPDERDEALAVAPKGTALVRLFNEHQDKTVAFLNDRDSPKATADTLQADLIKALKLGQELDLPNGLSPFDAEPLIYAHRIRDEYMRRIEAVGKTARTPEQVKIVNGVMKLMLENLVIIAQSEYEAGLYEKSSKR